MQLFPYTLIRIGGLPFNELAQFNLEDGLSEEIFNERLYELRLSLQLLSIHPNLQNGLVLSAPTLLDRITSFRKKTPEKFRKKERQTERTLMQFLARIVTKTSPFSTFSQIAIAPIKEQISFLSHPNFINSQSHIRFNNYLLKFFKDLLISDSATRQYLRLKLGATVYPQDNGYEFLTNSNNLEAFQTIEDNPVVDWVVDTMQSNITISLKKLINEMEESIDADRVDLEQFIFQLYEIGLLEFDFGISGLQAHWITDLRTFLQPIPTHLSQRLDKALADLYKTGLKYASSDAIQRRKILNTHLSLLQENFNQLNIAPTTETSHYFKKQFNTSFQFNHSNLLYEDYSTEVSASISANKVEQFTQLLNSFFNLLTPLDESPKRLALEYFYQTHFKNQTVPLLTFYKTYAQWKKNNSADSFQNDKKTILQKWQDNLLENLIINHGVVNISLNQLKKANLTLNAKAETNKKSFSAFVQFFETENDLKGVLNANTPGYGKYFSRFLHLFPNDITATLLQQNTQNNHIIHAEINDASYFNANIHPPLMPFEIALPNGNHQLPNEKRIPITDIAIRPSEQNILELFYIKNQKTIHPFDLGFQSHDGRSELFKLLHLFSPALFPPTHRVISTVNSQIDEDNIVRVFPRILIENQIVIQRKTWLISIEDLAPRQHNNESEYDFFQRMKTWQKKHKLPNELFYTINPRELLKDAKTMRTNDGYKPQYLNFQNPILVQLFSRDCKKVQTSLKLVEMLPNAHQLSQWNNQDHVTEYLIQWNN